MASMFRNPAEEEVQQYLNEVAAGRAGQNPRAQTLARSSNNPDAQAQGQAMLDQQAQDQERQIAADQRAAEQAAKQAAADQVKAAKEAAKAAEEERQRQVRIGASQGIKKTTDIQTGKTTLATLPDGSFEHVVGDVGAPRAVPAVNKALAGVPGLGDVVTGGMLGVPTDYQPTDNKALVQDYRNAQGQVKAVPLPTKTDPKTGQVTAATKDPFGAPQRVDVGTDQVVAAKAAKAAELDSRGATLGLRSNSISQTRLKFEPQWQPVKKEFDDAAKELKDLQEKRSQTMRRVDGKWQGYDPKTNTTGGFLDQREVPVWDHNIQEAQNRFDRAKAAHDKFLPMAENLNAQETAVKDANLQWAAEKIRHDANMPEEDGGAAETLAHAETGILPAWNQLWNDVTAPVPGVIAQDSAEIASNAPQIASNQPQIAQIGKSGNLPDRPTTPSAGGAGSAATPTNSQAAATQPAPPAVKRPLVPLDDPAKLALFQKAAAGLVKPEGVTVETRPSGISWLTRNGDNIGYTANDSAGNPFVVIGNSEESGQVRKHVNLGTTDGVPIYLKEPDGGKGIDPVAGARYVAEVFGAVNNPRARAVPGQSPVDSNPAVIAERLQQLKATPDQISAKVSNGELSVQQGQAIIQGIYTTLSLKIEDPADPASFGKWLSKQDATTKGEWTGAKNQLEKNIVKLKYLQQWEADNSWKPGLDQKAIQSATDKVIPKPQKAFFGVVDTLSGLVDLAKGFQTTPAAFYQAVAGLGRPDQYSPSARAAFDNARKFSQDMERKTAINQAEGTSTSVGESLRETGLSMPFSIISMAAYLAAKFIGGKVGRAAGSAVGVAVGAGSTAPAGGEGAVPGAALGGVIGEMVVGEGAGMFASATVAYRMAGAAFMYDSWQDMEDDAIRLTGKPMTEEKKQEAYKILLSLAQDTGKWEAGPEALGNAITAKIGGFVFGGTVKKKFSQAAMKSLAARMAARVETVATKVGATAWGAVGEGATETVTQVGQNLAQERAKLVREGKDPYSIGYDWSPGNINKAAGEVTPQVIAMMASFGLIRGTTSTVGKVINKVTGKPEEGTATAPDFTPTTPPPLPLTPEAQAVIDERDPAKVAGMHPNDYVKWQTSNVTPILGAPITTPEALGTVQTAIVAARERGDTATEQALTTHLQQSTWRTDWTAEELEMDDPAAVEQINNDARDFNQSLTDARTRLGIAEQPPTTQTNGQNLEGQTGPTTPAQAAQPATATPAPGIPGGSGGYPAPVAQSAQAGSNVAGLTVKDYLVSQATGVPGYHADIPTVVQAAIAAGRPVHVSMATRAGIFMPTSQGALGSMPAGYHQVGDMLQPIEAAPIRPALTPEHVNQAGQIATRLQSEVETSMPSLKGRVTIDNNPDLTPTGGVETRADGTLALLPQDIAVRVKAIGAKAAEAEVRDAIVRHEVRHLAQFKLVRKLWEAAGGSGSFDAFWNKFYGKGGIYTELMKTPKLFEFFKQIYDGKALNEAGASSWDSITGEANQAAEGVRILLEIFTDPARTADQATVTELLRAEGMQAPKLIQLLKDLIAEITQWLGDITSAKSPLAPAVKEHLAGVEKLYREFLGEPLADTPQSATPTPQTNGQAKSKASAEADAEGQKGQVLTSQAAGAQSPAATVNDGFSTNSKPNGTVDILLDGQMVDNVQADQVDAALAELRVIVTSPGRIVGQAMQAVLDAQPVIARDLKLKDALGTISDDLEALVGTYPPDQRRAFLDTAFGEWVAGQEAIIREKEAVRQSELNAISAERAKLARELRMERLRDQARAVLNSDIHETFSAIFAKGKISPKPNWISLMLKRKKNGAKLTEKELRELGNLSDHDGSLRMQDYGPLVREMLRMIYARQGEGLMPNVISDGLLPNVTTASEMFEALGKEARAIEKGTTNDSLDDPNHVWTEAEIEAELAKGQPQNPVTLYDARWEAAQAFGEDSLLVKKIDVVDEFADRFDSETLPDVLAAIYAEIGRINMEVVSAKEWQKRTEAFSPRAAIFQQFLDTHTPEAMRPKLEGMPVAEKNTSLASSPAPDSSDVRAIDANYNEDLLRLEMGEPMSGRSLQLGPASPALVLAGIPDGPVFMRKETALAKPGQDEHPYPRFLLRLLPKALRDPILVHESWTQPGAMVALLDVKHAGKSFVAALHFKPGREGIEITEVASFYPRESRKIMEAFARTMANQNGAITYYNKEKTREWLSNSSGSNSPQLWFQRLGLVKGIPTDAEIVKRQESGGSLKSSPAPETPSAGDLFASLVETPGPLAKLKENAQAAYDAHPEGHPARDAIAREVLTREGVKKPGGFVGQTQRALDFGVSGSLGTKDQPGFSLMSSPAPQKGSFSRTTHILANVLSKPADQYQYDNTPDPRPEIQSVVEELSRITKGSAQSVVLRELSGQLREFEQATGTSIGFFKTDAKVNAIGFTPFSRPNLILINADRGEIPLATTLVHELTHVAQKDSRTEASDVLRAIAEYLTEGEFATIENALLEEGYTHDDLEAEIPAFVMGDAVTGYNSIGLPHYKRGEELRQVLKDWFYALPRLAPNARPGERFADWSKQRSFDFGTSGSFTTRNQTGFDFGAKPTVKDSLTVQPAPVTANEGVTQPEPITANETATQPEPPEPGTPEFKALPQEEKLAAVKAITARKEAERKGIQDFGSKIGGARKDQATKTGPTGKKPTDERPGWARRYEISEVVSSSTEGEAGRFVISDLRDLDWRGQPRQATRETFATREDTEKAVPILAVARNHEVRMGQPNPSGDSTYTIWRKVSDRKRVQVVHQEFTSREDALRYMAQNAATIIETKTAWREELIAKPEKAVRTGKERRQGPATPEMFQAQFKFRGVEFGLWMRQQGEGRERQEVLNHAFDGLLDLADMLGIPPQAISLNGELGLAFGARGQGLQGAKAHYERNYAVINLTKMSGAGSLAHEFFHALDHYLGRQDGKAAGDMVKNADGDMVFKAKGREDDYVSHGFSKRGMVRPELRDAYDAVMKTMATKAVQYVEDSQAAERFVDRSRQELTDKLANIRKDLQRAPYVSDSYKERRKPATEAQLAAFDELAERLMDGQDLETEHRWNESKGRSLSGRWTNDTLEAINAIHKAVTNRTGFRPEMNGPLDSLRATMGNYRARIAMLESAAKTETKTRAVPTSYAMESKKIDQGSATDYWSTPHELAARAFSAYVEDRISDQGGQSDFLSYGSDNKFYRMFGLRPYPEGAERVAINQAFDHLFATMETKETERGVALMSSPAPESLAVKQEKREILATAPRGDDGHPLAPNGKRSNLTESQWATARTGNFKRWFGDWVESEKAKILTGPVVATAKLGVIQIQGTEIHGSEAAYRWLRNNPQNNIVRNGLGTVIYDEKSIEDTLGHGFSGPKLNALTAVANVIRNGVELDTSMDWEGKPLRNWIIAAPIDFDGKRHTMFVRIRKDVADPKSDHRFYIHEIVLEEWVKNEETSPFKSGSDPDVFRGKKSGGTGFYLSLARRALAVNPESVSKVVDENGEPRVVFHGTSAEFDEFDPNMVGKVFGYDTEGFFFSSFESDALDYAKNASRLQGGEARVVPVFLNISKPYTYAEHAFEFGDADTAEKGMDGRLLIDWADMYRRDHLRTAKETSKDGISIERGNEGLYTVFNPNQIKSATANNGEFSENPSILRSSPAPDSQPDLFAAATAPDATQRLGDVKVGTMSAPEPDYRTARTLDDAKSAAAGFIGIPLKNDNSSIVATVSNTNLGKMASNSAVSKSMSVETHAKAIANLDKLFQGAEMLESNPDKRGEGTIVAIHRFYAAMPTEQGKVAVKMTVKETTSAKNPNPLYTVETLEIKTPAGLLATDVSGEEQNRNAPLAGADKRVLVWWNKVNRQASLGSSPTPDSTPDLFAATHAPDATQRLGDVKVGTMSALGAYRTLTAKQQAGKTLTADEHQKLLSAEQALGQKLAFDMEAVKGAPNSQPISLPTKSAAPGTRSVQQGMALGEDGPGGQMALFSSPAPGYVDIDELMPYASGRERSTEDANSARGPASAAAQGLAEWLKTYVGTGDGADVQERIRQEAQSALSWAKENGRLIDPSGYDTLAGLHPNLGGQAEHEVFHVENSGRVIKRTIPPNFGGIGTAVDYLANIERGNRVFGDDIVLHGVVSDDRGISFVVSQPFVDGTRPTPEEIARWFENQGYQSAGFNRWRNQNTGVDIADAHDGNLIKTPAGDLVPIDLQIISAPTTASLASSPAPEMTAAVNQSLDKMPPMYRNVFEAVNGGASVPEVMAKFQVNEKAVDNILKAVRSRMATVTAAAGPAGLSPVMRGDKILGGRPDLAGSTIPEVAAIHQIRNESGMPGVVNFGEIEKRARATVKTDRQGVMDRLVAKRQGGEAFTLQEVAEAKIIVYETVLAGEDNTPAARVNLALLATEYIDQGSDDARRMGIRRDPNMTPAERAAQYIATELYTPDHATRKALKSASKTDQIAIMGQWMKQVDQIKAELLALGIDLDATLKEFREDEEARRVAAEESPRAAAVIEEQIRKLNLREKTVIDSIRQGALLTRAAFTAGVSNEEAKGIYTRFLSDIRTAMAASAKRFLETSLASSPVDMMGQILAELGLPDISAIDDSQPGFVDHRGEKQRAPRKPREKTPAAPQVEEITPEQQAALDEAFERFKAAKPATWSTFWQTEAKNLTPLVGAVGFAEFKGEAQKAWTADQVELFARERGAINETTGTFDLHDPVKMMTIRKAFSTARSSWMDKIMEFWRASILSGPLTAVVNISSNVLHMAYRSGPLRAAQAAGNNILSLVGLGSKDGATFGEFSAMTKELRNAAGLASRQALASWNTDSRLFEKYAEAAFEQSEFGGQGAEAFAPAMGGPIGTIMRGMSFRHMTMADEFIKFFSGHLEAATQAHRIAREKEGLQGDAYAARVKELMEPGSAAWQLAMTEAKRITFQTELDGKNPQMIRRIDQLAQLAKHGRAMPWIGRPLTFFLPFIDTPTAIFKEALLMSPVGAALAIIDGVHALKRRYARGNMTVEMAKQEAAKLYDRARLVEDITNQTIAVAVYFAISAMVGGDDDDDLPFMTGSLEYKSSKRGERDNSYAVMPPQSIRVGKNIFSYKRIEPFATVLSSMADMAREINRSGGVKPELAGQWIKGFMTQLKDKTFLQGIANLAQAYDDPHRFGTKLAGNIVTGFVPNILRQPLRNLDPMMRDTAPRADQQVFESIARNLGYSIVPQWAPLKMDVWGRPISKNRGEVIAGNRVVDGAVRLLDPTNITVNPQIDPIDGWIFRYNLATADSKQRIGIEPIGNSLQFKVPGEKKSRTIPLTVEEQSEANRRAGQQARSFLGDGWESRPLSEDNAELILDTMRRSQKMARDQLKMSKIEAGLPPLP